MWRMTLLLALGLSTTACFGGDKADEDDAEDDSDDWFDGASSGGGDEGGDVGGGESGGESGGTGDPFEDFLDDYVPLVCELLVDCGYADSFGGTQESCEEYIRGSANADTGGECDFDEAAGKTCVQQLEAATGSEDCEFLFADGMGACADICG